MKKRCATPEGKQQIANALRSRWEKYRKLKPNSQLHTATEQGFGPAFFVGILAQTAIANGLKRMSIHIFHSPTALACLRCDRSFGPHGWHGSRKKLRFGPIVAGLLKQDS
ncbi:hypothetical protein H6F90_00525 [Trichocoleus sp. FACHB-591]|uniref:hypothetical protein n=1 Tax=Trichocoleus sp. FACHB-591 TaxID=2692872 RepID=UPI001683A3A5|nr:hypothetical protein [Trichocoleus sp. FACHB-591]MBD2093640.1 hypothetical protein [Trichocoleus sp. FACHB-591]